MTVDDKIRVYRQLSDTNSQFVLQIEDGALVCYCDTDRKAFEIVKQVEKSVLFKDIKSLATINDNNMNDNWLSNIDRELLDGFIKQCNTPVIVSRAKPSKTFSGHDMSRLGLVGLYVNPKG